MKKTKTLVRVLSLALAALLLLGVIAVPLTALAAESGKQTVSANGKEAQGDVTLKGTVEDAQRGEMTVQVVDAVDGTAVPGVRVTLVGKDQSVVTDAQGQATFPDMPFAVYEIRLEKSGYATKTYSDVSYPASASLITLSIAKSGGGIPPDSGDSGDDDHGGGTVKPTPTPKPSVTPTPSATPGPSVTPTPSATPGPKPTETPVPTATAEPEPGGSTEPAATPRPSQDIPSPAPSPGTEQDGTDEGEGEAGVPSAEPSGQTPEVPQDPNKPVKVETPADRVQLSPEIIEQSAVNGSEVQIDFVDRDGTVEEQVVLAPFDPHDKELLQDSELWVECREKDRPVIQLLKERKELITDASIPHNVIQAARERQADVRVTFQTPDGEAYDFDARFIAGFFDPDLYDHQDTTMEYDPAEEQGWLVFSNQAQVHAVVGSIVIPEEAYRKAAEDGWGIKTRIYNPKDDTDLWYEWVFYPEDLKQAARTVTSTDLFITPEKAAENSELLDTLDTRRNRVQYMVIPNYHGALPVPATLRVKNMAGFAAGDSVALVYANEESGALETVVTGLTVGEAGFITYGIDHCSSYALTAPISLWWLIYAVVGGIAAMLLLFLLLFLLLKRRKKPDQLAWLVLCGCDMLCGEGVAQSSDEILACTGRLNAGLGEKALSYTPEDVEKRLAFWTRRKCLLRQENGQAYSTTERGKGLLSKTEAAGRFGFASEGKENGA